MKRERAILCACGVVLSIICYYVLAPTLQSNGNVIDCGGASPSVLLGLIGIGSVVIVVLLLTRNQK